jgi:outer membrane receptor protein involved in Fe transport
MRQHLFLGCASLTAVLMASGVHAQTTSTPQAATEDSGTMGEIIVTANRRDEKLLDVPASITAFSGDSLRQLHIQQIEDYAALVPGLAISAGGQNENRVSLRGVETTDFSLFASSTVGFYLDDIPIDNGTLARGTTDLRMFDLQRLEVLRGPQGTLFGSGTLSGAIRMITNKPDPSGAGARLEGTASLVQHGNVGGELNAMINVPLIADRAAIRAVGYYSLRPGYIDNLARAEKNVNTGKDYGGRLLGLFDLTDNLQLTALVSHQVTSPDDNDRALPNAPGQDPYVYNLVLPFRAKQQYTIFNFGASLDLGHAKIISQSTWQRRKLDITYDGTGYANLGAAIFFRQTTTTPTPLDNATFANTFSQELRIVSDTDGPIRWTIGGFYSDRRAGWAQSIFPQDYLKFAPSTNLFAIDIGLDQTEKAVFGEITAEPLKGLELTAGGRYFKNSLSFNAVRTGILLFGNFTTNSLLTGKRNDDGFNPKFSISYKPTDSINIYAAASKGYRTGGVNNVASAAFGIQETYRPDTLWNYELGVKAALMDGRLNLAVTAYRIDWSDLQLDLVNTFSYLANAGSARIDGIEVEAGLRVNRALSIGTSFSVNHARLTEDVPTIPSGPAFDGDRLPTTPKFRISNFINIALPTKFDSYIRVDHQYTSRVYKEFAQRTPYGNYNLIGVRAGAHIDGTEVILGISNIFESRGKAGANPSGSAAGVLIFPETVFYVRPRTFSITLGRSF